MFTEVELLTLMSCILHTKSSPAHRPATAQFVIFDTSNSLTSQCAWKNEFQKNISECHWRTGYCLKFNFSPIKGSFWARWSEALNRICYFGVWRLNTGWYEHYGDLRKLTAQNPWKSTIDRDKEPWSIYCLAATDKLIRNQPIMPARIQKNLYHQQE